jgi:glycerol-3-phosphate dehydrogenase
MVLPLSRPDLLARLRAEAEWDVIVVGGGATGLGVALDATTRGLRTLLLEAGDFAQGTSSRSTKLIHGGVRYLAQLDIHLVREALRERGLLLKNAPPVLVRSLGFVLPCYGWGELPYYAAGLKFYDGLAGRLGLAPSRLLSAGEVRRQIPTIARRDAAGRGLKGGILYFDGQFDDARLAISLMRSVHAHGGLAINGCEVTGLIHEGSRLAGVEARAAEGDVFALRGRAVVNATGVWVDGLRRMDEAGAPPLLSPSQGAHVVLDRDFLPGERALLVPRTADGRVLFCIPWLGRVLVGTTDTPRPALQDAVFADPRPLPGEVDFLLVTAGQVLDRRPQSEDVRASFAGLRPLVKAAPGMATSQLSREHLIQRSPSGLITVAGGKWTTYRRMGEEVVDALLRAAGLPWRGSITAELPLEPLDYGPDASPRLHPDFPWTEQDVRNACRYELARNVEDVLLRRTRLGMVDEAAARAAAPRVAALMAEAGVPG